MGPGDLSTLIGELVREGGQDERVLVGPETGDDAGVIRYGDGALVATADFITPVCDDAERYGRVAAANALSDVYAMGGEPVLALNLCCFPEDLPAEAGAGILRGGARAVAEAGAAVLGGHTVRDAELKYGLAVVGRVDPARLTTNAGARPGDRLVLTKPLGTGVLINAFQLDRIGEAELEPALVQMERLNGDAARLAAAAGARAATDVTGFGFAGHALGMARASGVGLVVRFHDLPAHDGFLELARKGVTTGCTKANRDNVAGGMRVEAELRPEQLELLVDPQTSGGLLVSAPAAAADELLRELTREGHGAAIVGEVVDGPAGLRVL